MNVTELIRKKRDGKKLLNAEIEFLVSGYSKRDIPDYQFAAFLMAVYLKGMTKSETAALTHAMLYSGKVLDLSTIQGFKVDKHSTGGVGDKTSLILAPIVAAAGVNVPMISGRGLGHTGGTLDKLESIPGFKTNLNLTAYKKSLLAHQAVLIGQTKDIAPADKLIYALRDVTGTVESIPLITGSIMSKKLAEGIDGLVLDIKTGSGAFMKTQKDAMELSKSLINTAKAFKKKVMAFITDMNQPLGNYIGNWLEVYESVKVLEGADVEDLNEVTHNLSGAMIYQGGKADSLKEGIAVSKEMIASGKAYDKFKEIVEFQGGDFSYIKNLKKYKKAKYKVEIKAATTGYVSAINNYEVGMSALELGAGRRTKEDVIDPKAGIIFNAKIGKRYKKNDLLAELFTDNKRAIDSVEKRIEGAISFSKAKVGKPKLIKKIIT
jgi:pyrimidine-nucleoside phosphorylase